MCKNNRMQTHSRNLPVFMTYLLAAIRFTPGGSSTVHIYIRMIHRTTQLTKRTIQFSTRTTQLTT